MKYVILAICLMFPVVAFADMTTSIGHVCWKDGILQHCDTQPSLTKEQERAVLEKYGYTMPECVDLRTLLKSASAAIEGCMGDNTDCPRLMGKYNELQDRAKHGGLCAD